MALKVSSDGQLVFFNKVFGAFHPVTQEVKALLGVGVTFEVSLYALRAYTDHGKTGLGSLTLTAGTTALIKGTVEPVVVGHNKNLIEGWIKHLFQKQGSPAIGFTSTDVILVETGTGNKLVLIKAVLTATGKGLKESKDLVENVPSKLGSYPSLEAATKVEQAVKAAGGVVILQPTGKTLPPFTTFHVGKPVTGGLTIPPSKPVPEVISLKDAKALGQKVHGTSSGSVYYCIAYSEHVKLAARLSAGGSVSIRAEWTDNPAAELKLLAEAGVNIKSGSGYGSIHFDAANVPLPRVVGAFLVGTGINWKAAVINGAELVVGA